MMDWQATGNTIEYAFPQEIAAEVEASDVRCAYYARQSSGVRRGASGSLRNAQPPIKKVLDDDMGGILKGQQGGVGGQVGEAGRADDGPRTVRPAFGIDRTERNQREYDANRLGRPAKASAMAENHISSSAHIGDAVSHDMRGRIHTLKMCPCPSCGVISAPNTVVVSSAAFDVNVCTRVGSYSLSVSPLMCGECLLVWTPEAAAAGCYAAQAGESRVSSHWYTIDLLDHVSSELLFRGTSFLAVAAAFGSPAEPFSQAWFEYHRTAFCASGLAALGVVDIDTGPMGGCPVCSDVNMSLGPRPAATSPLSMWWETTHHRLSGLRLSVMMDATNTLDLKPGAGSASDLIPPSTDTFLSAALQKTLADLLKLRRAGGQDASPSDDEGDGGCAPGENYKAGRRAPTRGSKKKSEGVCGACCAEGIPLRGLYFSMDDTHECFLFYDYIVDAIILHCNGVNYIFLDFGCKFGRHYLRRQKEAPLRIEIVVPAMHAEGHVKRCRLLHCGIYLDGLGYIMGEEMEQLWYVSKFWSASTRSMSRAERIDFLNFALAWVTKRKVANMYKTLTKKVRDMRALDTTYSKTLMDLANVRLSLGKEADLPSAHAWMREHCVLLTRLETGGDNDADHMPVDYLPIYALNIVKDSLTRNAAGTDAGRSYDFFFTANLKGRGTQKMEKLMRALDASLARTEADHDMHLMSLGWLARTCARLELATLLALPSFREQLDVVKRNEMSALRTAVAVTVCELKALEQLMSQRGHRSSENAPNKKNNRAKAGLLNTIAESLHSLSKWEAWTVTADGVCLAAAAPRPSGADIAAATSENYPWNVEVGGSGDAFDGMRAMLETYRAISAKLARVLKEIIDLPTKFEKVYYHHKNLRLRISQCSDRKKASLESIKAELVVIRQTLSTAEHVSACSAAPCGVGCEVGVALQAQGKKLAEGRKLEGEIEMLRSHLERAVQDAASFDERAGGAGWEFGPDDFVEYDSGSDDDYGSDRELEDDRGKGV